MEDDQQRPIFRDLSVMLEKQLETVLANQRVLIAMHETLLRLLPKYETAVANALENPTASKTEQQDVERWTTRAKKTLLELREKK